MCNNGQSPFWFSRKLCVLLAVDIYLPTTTTSYPTFTECSCFQPSNGPPLMWLYFLLLLSLKHPFVTFVACIAIQTEGCTIGCAACDGNGSRSVKLHCCPSSANVCKKCLLGNRCEAPLCRPISRMRCTIVPSNINHCGSRAVPSRHGGFLYYFGWYQCMLTCAQCR